jgi:O-antigen ligase
MFAIPGIVLLLTAIYARPQEIFAGLGAAPVLHVLLGLAVFGAAIDLRRGHTRLRSTPLLVWVGAFVAWAYFTVLVRSQGTLPAHAWGLAICAALYLLVGHAVQTFRGLAIVAGSLVAMVLLVSAVAVEQRFAPTGCVQIDESVPGDTTSGRYDGRPCSFTHDCYLGDAEPGAEYMCENIGLLGTTSVGKGRVRYRGVLQDPNELALAAALGIPLAFALSRVRKRSWWRRALLVLTFGLVLVCAVLTRSRSGQLVFLAVLAVPLARRFGTKGMLGGAILAAPLLVLGGRAGMEATSSVTERVDCWAEAISIWRAHPLLGAGLGQFGKYHYLTAHNSFLLALAELGFVGMFLFTTLAYLGLKIPFVAWRETAHGDSPLGAPEARSVVGPWALGLVALWAGLVVGAFFLSFTYHYVLWIHLGLVGAFHSAIRRHDASFRVPFGWRDVFLIVAIDIGIIVSVYAYTRVAL